MLQGSYDAVFAMSLLLLVLIPKGAIEAVWTLGKSEWEWDDKEWVSVRWQGYREVEQMLEVCEDGG